MRCYYLQAQTKFWLHPLRAVIHCVSGALSLFPRPSDGSRIAATKSLTHLSRREISVLWVKFASALILDRSLQLVFCPLLRGAYAGDANIARYASLLDETVSELS